MIHSLFVNMKIIQTIKIKSSAEITQVFDFNFVSRDDISKIINSLDPTKKISGAIPTKIIKLANKKICKDLANCINERIKQNKFRNELKIADITPIFKKDDPLDKTNYRPISILGPTVSKIFKIILCNQLQRFSNKILSPPSALWFQERVQYSICPYKPTPKMAKVS